MAPLRGKVHVMPRTQNLNPLLAVTAFAAVFAASAIVWADPSASSTEEKPLQSYAAMPGGSDALPVPQDLSVYDTVATADQNPGADEPYCDIKSVLTNTLDHDFAEHPTAEQARDDGTSVALWASEEMGTWTVVYTRRDGKACVISSGTGWNPTRNAADILSRPGMMM
jgi:hypothetical protein